MCSKANAVNSTAIPVTTLRIRIAGEYTCKWVRSIPLKCYSGESEPFTPRSNDDCCSVTPLRVAGIPNVYGVRLAFRPVAAAKAS
jgi:hypothetical protein